MLYGAVVQTYTIVDTSCDIIQPVAGIVYVWMQSCNHGNKERC